MLVARAAACMRCPVVPTVTTTARRIERDSSRDSDAAQHGYARRALTNLPPSRGSVRFHAVAGAYPARTGERSAPEALPHYTVPAKPHPRPAVGYACAMRVSVERTQGPSRLAFVASRRNSIRLSDQVWEIHLDSDGRQPGCRLGKTHRDFRVGKSTLLWETEVLARDDVIQDRLDGATARATERRSAIIRVFHARFPTRPLSRRCISTVAMRHEFRMLSRVSAVGLLVAASAVAAQEHSYTQADIENGSRLYQSSCAGCHGPNGDMVPGIELLRGQFRRATSDTEIMRIIQTGIPGTTMPPASFTEAQAGTIVAYLRSAAPASGRGGSAGNVPRGDAARGRAIFEGEAQCATCHRVNGMGPRVAPDLTDIGAIRQALELQQKILDPSRLIRPANRVIEVLMKDGTKMTGHLLNQDTFTIQLLDSRERLLSLSRVNVRDFSVVKESPMPSYRDRLTSEEVNDLVTYLVSLKGLRP